MLSPLNNSATATTSNDDKHLVYHKTKFFDNKTFGWVGLSSRKLLQLVSFLLVWFFFQPQLVESPIVEGQLIVWMAFPFFFFVLLVYIIYQGFKEKQKEIIEAVRIKLSADLHDDVGSILSGIAMQAEILECCVAEEHKEKVGRLAARSREAMAQMRDTVWTLDARKDNWGSLVDRLQDHAAEILEPRQMDYSIKIEGINRQKNLSAEIRQHLYLIGKEAITNAAKHSNGDQLSILLRQQNDLLEMFIQDNGHIDQEQPLTVSGLGLSNISLRARELGAQLNIHQNGGFGISLCFSPA